MQSFAHNSHNPRNADSIESSNNRRECIKSATRASDRIEAQTLARAIVDLPLEKATEVLNRATGIEVRLDTTPGDQDQERFDIVEDNQEKSFRFHEYGEVFRREGLYETILRGVEENTVSSVADALVQTLQTDGEALLDCGIRHLDFGAGTGRVPDAVMARLADQFPETPVQVVVGLDIAPEAREAALRDRPGLYDAYVIGDLLDPSSTEMVDTLRDLRFNLLTVGSAVGFGDIPFAALWRAVSVVDEGGDMFV